MMAMNADPLSESRNLIDVYVPRDEVFSDVKLGTFSVKTVKSVLHALVPQIETAIVDPKLGFPYFTAIDSLFDEGVELPKDAGFFRTLLPRIVKAVDDTKDAVLLFETPEMIDSMILTFILTAHVVLTNPRLFWEG